VRIGFYATMKPPDDPVPSGDRTMARQLTRALEFAGHRVEVLSKFKCRLKSPGGLQALETEAAGEAEAIAQIWQRAGPPDVVVTYHVYYKSPDLIGAALARRFGLPYVTIEASHAGKRDIDEWAKAQAHCSAAITQASLNICLTERDAEGIAKIAPPDRVVILPPFLDLSGLEVVRQEKNVNDPVELVVVAMMLKGNKVNSFMYLAKALELLSQANWRLTIVGDGPVRLEVETMFAGLHQVRFAGQMDRQGVAGYLARSDVFVWPGYREAFGLAYLEAQAMGLPVVAMNSGGVDSVVIDGHTGLLVDEGDVAAFASALDELIGDRARRVKLGRQAHEFVRQARSLETASDKLAKMLAQVVAA